MLGILKNPPEPFGDVIRAHFKLKAQSILLQLEDWLAEDNGQQTIGDGAHMALKDLHSHSHGSSSSSFQRDVEELKTLLVRLQED